MVTNTRTSTFLCCFCGQYFLRLTVCSEEYNHRYFEKIIYFLQLCVLCHVETEGGVFALTNVNAHEVILAETVANVSVITLIRNNNDNYNFVLVHMMHMLSK